MRPTERRRSARRAGPDRVVSITAISSHILRIRASADGRWLARRSWAVTPPDDDFPAPAVEIEVAPDRTSIATPALVAVLDGAGSLTISTAGGRVLVADSPGGGASFDADSGRSTWTHEMPRDRRYFGFGERTGTLEKRGRRYTCWTTDEWRHQGPATDSLYVAIPYFMGLDPNGDAFGIFLNTTRRSAFDLTDLDANTLRMEVDGPELDWYLILGPEPADVVRRFSELVGRAELPPRWAFGYHQARWSYASEDEVREVAAQLRDHGIPADAITIDIDHMDGYRVFTWDPRRFSGPGRLLEDLSAMGLRTMVVVDAAVKQDPGAYDIYDEGRRNGYFVRTAREADAEELTGYLWPGISVLPDQVRAGVRRWWGDLYRRYTDVGVAGFVNDMNEPALHDRPIRHPETANWEPPPDTPFGPDAEPTTHAEIRNVYGSLEDRASVEGLLRAAPGTRPFIVTRAGFAGIQRYAAVWTGDNASYWEHLEMSLPQLLNLGVSGVPFAGADIGGFFGDCPDELLVRWAQLGAVYPFARNNSAEGTARQEPWARGEPTTSRFRRAIELRYRLLPYLYSVAWEATQTGVPLLRPMFFHEPADAEAHAIGDQAYLGRDLLVAPVVHPGRTHRDVHIPAGTWYDLRSTIVHRGPADVLVSAGLDEGLPIFARAGSVIPLAPVMAWTDERPVDPLTLRVFLDDDGRAGGSVYEDDGTSREYLNGGWSVTRVSAQRDGGTFAVSSEREGAYEPPGRTIEILVRDGTSQALRAVDDARSWKVTIQSEVPPA